ncbi:MAG TPA: hypothetical protein VGS96_14695 [Thermoanaerobaculia bacterium]|jgi:hypothetical protein|nr:hypothetical protein [Thermoanaerobaculia bacterium]
MTANNRSIALGALVAFALLAPRAEATLMKSATFDEKVENAAAIVLGTAVKKETRWDASHRWILTYTTFRIEKSYKGLPAQQEITIVTPGGQVGDLHQDTPGVPEFAVGSDNVLFIRNSSQGPTVLFFDQGAYDVDKNRLVKPVASDAVTIDTQRGMAVPAEEPRTLQQFERDVRDAEQRGAIKNRMEMIKRQPQEPPSLWSTIVRNKFLIALAIAGVALATWQYLRR